MSNPLHYAPTNPDMRILGPDGMQVGGTLVRPGSILGGASPFFAFVSYCDIQRENPTLNLALTGAYSDTDSNYDGTTYCRKMLFNFERPVTIPNSRYAQLFLGEFNNFSDPITGGSSGSKCEIGVSAGTLGFGVVSNNLNVRWQAITAPFVTASQTWNNRGSLSLGASDNTGLCGAGISTAAGDTARGPYNASPGAAKGGPIFRVTGPITCYGFLVDVEPVTAISLGTATVTYRAAKFGVLQPSSTAKSGLLLM